MFAGMAELADAQASGACGSNIVWVQVPFPALKCEVENTFKPSVLMFRGSFAIVYNLERR